jgi:hypothetical protein
MKQGDRLTMRHILFFYFEAPSGIGGGDLDHRMPFGLGGARDIARATRIVD